MAGGRLWTADEIGQLRTLARTASTRNLALRFGRSYGALRTQASKMGITTGLYHPNCGMRRQFKGDAAAIRPTTRELAWAAGFLEGEGSFNLKCSRVGAPQVEREPLERLHRLFGGRICPKPVGAARRLGIRAQDAWYWYVNGPRARGVMLTLYTLLSTKRRAQIRASLGVDAVKG